MRSVSEGGVTSSGIASSDRLQGQKYNPPSHSQRTTARPQFGRAAARGPGARPRLTTPPRCCCRGWAPNPVCCGATGEGPAAAAARPGRLYSLGPAAGGGRSKGRAGRSARSTIWSPSCCFLQQWSTPSDKPSYFAALLQRLLESRETQQRSLWSRATWVYRDVKGEAWAFWPLVGSMRLTYAFTILEESKRAVPRVQMDSNDGTLSKPRGEVHFVSFMMQQAWQKTDKQ